MDLLDSQSASTPLPSRDARPPPCEGCGGVTWWNGWRLTFPQLSEGRAEMWLPKVRCKARRCSDFIVRPRALYPHRQYQPDVVGDVVAAVALGGEVPAKAAARATASATSARRWTKWVAQLVEPLTLIAATRKIDPDAPAGAGLSVTASARAVRYEAAQVLAAFEQLGMALVRRGVELVSRTGLGRVLEWQYRFHRVWVGLVAEPDHLSPALAIGGLGKA
jgi:hypothetical protein